jgi:hypothetical protein
MIVGLMCCGQSEISGGKCDNFEVAKGTAGQMGLDLQHLYKQAV